MNLAKILSGCRTRYYYERSNYEKSETGGELNLVNLY